MKPPYTLERLGRWVLKQMPDSTCAAMDRNLLLKAGGGYTQVDLLSHPEQRVSRQALKSVQRLAARRSTGEPMAYILGSWGFMDMELEITRSVLIPRPETELLVELLLDLPLPEHTTLLDLGTGSGAIALSVARNRPNWQIVATDISHSALRIAAQNARRLRLDNVHFVCADWFDGLACLFDLIVSNPPYLAASDPHLADLGFEPVQALVAGSNGMACIEQIVRRSGSRLKPEGWLLIEHGYDQKTRVGRAFRDSGFEKVASHRDLNGHSRVMLGRRPL